MDFGLIVVVGESDIFEMGLNFDYVAMGHIHKTTYAQNKKIIYPGSPISFGFDELGEHGMVVRRNK